MAVYRESLLRRFKRIRCMSSAGDFLTKLATHKKQTLLALCTLTIVALTCIHLSYPRAMASIKENTSQKLAGVVNLASLTAFASTDSPLIASASAAEAPSIKSGDSVKNDQKVAVTTTVKSIPPAKPTPAAPSVIEIPDIKVTVKSLMPSNAQLPSDESSLIQKKPSVVVIGTPVCGLPALYSFLRVHPKIAINDRELNFFSMTDVYAKGVDWYISQMPKVSADTVMVEQGHHYVLSRAAPERMKTVTPDMKIIYVICDATFRAFAQYLDLIHANDTTLIVANGTVNKDHKALIYSQYSEHYTNWLNFFPKENFYVLESDMLLRNPIEEMGKVEDFLGVSTVYNPQYIYFNSSAFTYCVKDNGKNHCLKANAIAKAPNEFPHEIVYKVREYLRPFSDKMFDMVSHKYNWL